MNLSDIITKCYILALIIRDDGERLLLGDGIYEFKSSLQHFAPNIYQNDVVELQGTDGQLLAGQVRRSATQSFDGYIADGTIGKTDTEQSRRRFLGFFRKKHHYKVVYIMPDGTAVQRDRGYIVDAPAVQELYQRFPEYHIGLNFEDPNYYEYAENDEGEEIYTHIQAIALFRELEAGLVWDAFGGVSDDLAWTEYMTENSTDGYILIGNGLPVEAPLSLTHLYGNATQQTIPGINQLSLSEVDIDDDHRIVSYYGSNITAGTHTISFDLVSFELGTNTSVNLIFRVGSTQDTNIIALNSSTTLGRKTYTYSINDASTVGEFSIGLTMYNAGGRIKISNVQLEEGSEAHDYTQFVGGVDSPNPDYPQEVNVVTGAQTVKITGKNLWGGIGPFSRTHGGIDFTTDSDGTIHANGTATATAYSISSSVALANGTYITIKPGTYRAYVNIPSDANYSVQLRNVRTDSTVASTINSTYNSRVFTIEETIDVAFRAYFATGMTADNVTIKPMLSLGSDVTDYEPYHGQSQTINLGALELCKIGTYQDYIWNDNGTWKIHKEVGKATVSLGTTVYTLTNGLKGSTYTPSGKIAQQHIGAYCNRASNSSSSSASERWAGSFYENAGDFMFIGTSTDDSAALKAKYDGATLYFVLETPTDTEITDSELIEQLDHIYELYQGTNNLWLIPSAGAQGEMTVRFGVAYDDDGSGYHWSEELGSPDNIISNDGIDSVRPIWIINGPATNPTLTNITTAQTITWNGTVPADSTLTVDMERQTATLNGANVYAQIEGDWLELAVGPNKLQYTASGGATEDSTLEWNGVAG